MKNIIKTIFVYLVFSATLMASILILPAFRFSETLAVLFATLIVLRHLSRLSVLVLSIIVIAVVDVPPIVMFYRIAGGTGLHLSHYLLPINWSNVINDLTFVFPILVLLALYALSAVLANKRLERGGP